MNSSQTIPPEPSVTDGAEIGWKLRAFADTLDFRGDEALVLAAADLIKSQAQTIERLRAALTQISVGTMLNTDLAQWSDYTTDIARQALKDPS